MSRSNSAFELVEVQTDAQVATVRALVREYAAWIDVDLCFQEIDAEIDGLPGKYAAAHGGVLLLALNGTQPAGCVALRALEPGICEMKRLWVRASASCWHVRFCSARPRSVTRSSASTLSPI